MNDALMKELAGLLNDLGEIESEIKAHEYGRDQLRERITALTVELGGRVTIPNVGTVMVMGDSATRSYDTKALDALVRQLIADGDVHSAKAITECEKTSSRKGGLRITREK